MTVGFRPAGASDRQESVKLSTSTTARTRAFIEQPGGNPTIFLERER
jgi:hypothetical protein